MYFVCQIRNVWCWTSAISCCGWKLTISIIMYDYNTYRSLQGYILHVINWLSDNACTERSRVGQGSALQGQSDWEKPLMGVLKSIRLKWTQKLCSLLAGSQSCLTLRFPHWSHWEALDHHQADYLKNSNTSTKFSLKRLRAWSHSKLRK